MSAKRKRDPYATLGVARDASAKDVRAAYRRKAKLAHPDAGGSAEEFSELTKAHDILLDPVRRLTFDTTGEADDASPDNGLAEVMNIINSIFDQIAQRADNPTSIDVVAETAEHIDRARYDLERKVHDLTNVIARTTKLAMRVKRRSGENFIKRMLDDKVNKTNNQIAAIKRDLDKLTRARALIDEFTFDVDRPPSQYMTINLQRSMFSTSTSI